MSEWKKIKLKDFLSQYRVTHIVQDDKYYGQITISKNNTIKFRESNIGKNIGRKRQFIIDLKKYPQTLIFTRQGVLDGSIGIAPEEVDGCIATENMPMFSINYEVIHPELLLYLIKSEMFKQKVKTIMPTGSAQKAIHERELLELDFLLPSKIEHQQKLVNTLKRYDEIILPVLDQENLNIERIKKLRQAILQEAIEGKLTENWRIKNPVCLGDPNTDAAALLETIKAEKQKLITEGKIKKEKPLTPINPNDMPFTLPDGWVWVRLGEIAINFDYGSSSKSSKEGKVPVLRMGNIQNGCIDWEDLVYTNNNNEITKYSLTKFDLLFNRTNSRELVGKTALFNSDKYAIHAGYLVRFKMLGLISPFFTNYLMNSKFHREWCNQVKTDAIGQSNINATKLKDFIFPLPPLAEQQAIVERVDRLLNHINALEQQTTERKHHAEQLMQTVLKEAFTA